MQAHAQRYLHDWAGGIRGEDVEVRPVNIDTIAFVYHIIGVGSYYETTNETQIADVWQFSDETDSCPVGLRTLPFL